MESAAAVHTKGLGMALVVLNELVDTCDPFSNVAKASRADGLLSDQA
jgi:hypothetical protein